MIIFLDLIIISVVFGIILFLITQIGIPLRRGTPLFPQFRQKTELKKKVEEAEHALEETQEYIFLKEELNKLNRRKAELEKKE